MGTLSRIIGIALSGVGAMILSYGMTSGGNLLFYFLGIIVMSIGLSLLTARRRTAETKPPPPTVTEIHCDNPECDFKEIRDFESGDYILKPLEATCPRCSSTMTIQGIYIIREEPDDSIKI